MARTYKRDSRGRFSGGGGGGRPGTVRKPGGARRTRTAPKPKSAFQRKGGKLGKANQGVVNKDARALYKQAAGQQRRAVRAMNNSMQDSKSGNRYTYNAARSADRKLVGLQLRLSGRKSEYAAQQKRIRESDAIEARQSAQRTVSNARQRAAKTVRGKVAAVKRFLSGGKRRK